MTSAISSLSSSSTTSATSFDPSKGAARFASKVFGDMDTDKDGSVTKDEFVKGLESKGVSADDAAKQYAAIDTQGTGSITQDDLQTAIQNGTFKPPRPQGGEGGGGHGGGVKAAGGAGGAGAAGGASGASSSSATKTYPAADSNEDGTVSQQEQLIYDLSHATSSTSDSSKIGTTINETA